MGYSKELAAELNHTDHLLYAEDVFVRLKDNPRAT